jgi:hypothetical protein
VPHETGRRELGVALDELESDPELVGDGAQQRRLARARRPLQQDVASRGQGRYDDLLLPPAPDDPSRQAVEQGAVGQNVITPRMFLPSRMSW